MVYFTLSELFFIECLQVPTDDFNLFTSINNIRGDVFGRHIRLTNPIGFQLGTAFSRRWDGCLLACQTVYFHYFIFL